MLVDAEVKKKFYEQSQVQIFSQILPRQNSHQSTIMSRFLHGFLHYRYNIDNDI
jgi:hypothetical protein